MSPLAAALERAVPWTSRWLHGGFFPSGVDWSLWTRVASWNEDRSLSGLGIPVAELRDASCSRDRWTEEWSFASRFGHPLPERNQVWFRIHGSGPRRRAAVVLNHGTSFYATLEERVQVPVLRRAGFDVVLPAAPGFYRRRPRSDWRRNWATTVADALAMVVQLVHDEIALLAWLRERGYRFVAVTGLGTGGTAAALLASVGAGFDRYVIAMAPAEMGDLWRPSALLSRAVRWRALQRDGVAASRLHGLFRPVSLLELPAPRDRGLCSLVAAEADRIVLPDCVRSLARRWGIDVRWVPGPHTAAPKVARAVCDLVLGRACRAEALVS